MPDEFEYRDVWRKDDAETMADVKAFWRDTGALSESASAEERVNDLCVVAYNGSKVIAVSTAKTRPLPQVRTKMAFFRAFVAPDYRSRKILIPLTFAVHETMSRYALAHPQERIGGTAAIVTSENGIYKPVGSADMILIGYVDDYPILVRWFDHYRF